jgi:Domain of unknown function (DUF4920)
MKRIVCLAAFFMLATFAVQAQDVPKGIPKYFGDKIDNANALPATDIPKLLGEKTELTDIKVYGTVNGVCQSKGCWMTLTIADGKEMTIKFKDYAFFMPKDCSGSKATLYGKVTKTVTSVKELRHLAKDAGKSKAEIKKIKQPKEELRFEASGVILEG